MSRINAGLVATASAALLVIATPTASANAVPSNGVATEFETALQFYADPTTVTVEAPVADAPGVTVGQTASQALTEADATPPIEEMGPSKWTGRTLRHPDGGRIPKVVSRWANLVREVMKEHKIPGRYLEGILAQIQQESFGNPRAVNKWDSNAAAGDPSKGLLQVIGSTYKMHAKKGYKNLKYQDVPYTNIYAALKYVKVGYGMGKFQSWNSGANHGY